MSVSPDSTSFVRSSAIALMMTFTLAAANPQRALAVEQVGLHSSGTEVLLYQAEPLSRPLGDREFSADKFRASHFIHPLKTPSGFIVSASQPEDHRHHFGLWWPWKYIQNGDRKIITWDLQRGEGFVVATKHRLTDHGIIAEAEYVDNLANDHPEVLLRETATITVSDVLKQPARGYLLDISIAQTPAVGRDVTVTEYRYSGFSIRGTLFWDGKNSSLLTSDGKTNKNANATRARWVRFEGATPAGSTAGIVMMSRPDNHNHPEQIRVWDNGQAFINFNPVMSESWTLHPGTTYTRNYRVFVYDGAISVDQAESLWKDYSSSIVGR
jgi:hypothetical protein